MEDFNKRIQAKKELIKAKITGSVTNQDSLEKGTYKDNDENKRLNRVGQKYGGKGVKGEEKTDKKVNFQSEEFKEIGIPLMNEILDDVVENYDSDFDAWKETGATHLPENISSKFAELEKMSSLEEVGKFKEAIEKKIKEHLKTSFVPIDEVVGEEKETREELFNQIDELRGEDLEDYLGLEEGETDDWDGTDREEAINDYLDAKFEEEDDEALSDEAGTNSETISSEEIEEAKSLLLQISEPQDGKFIGAYEVANDPGLKDFREDRVEDLDDPDQIAKVNKMLDHFVKNTQVETISYGDLFDQDVENYDDEEPFEVEESYSVDKLKDTSVEVPEGYSHFQILPVDYNRGGDDIVIVYMTEEGNRHYSESLTGDY